MNQIRRPRSPLPLILLKKLISLIFDPRLRVVLGALLILGGVLWMRENSSALEAVTATAASATDTPSVSKAKQTASSLWNALQRSEGQVQPLQLSGVPSFITSWFDSPNPILAGLLLIASAFVSNTLGLLGLVLAALIAFAGHKLGIPIPKMDPLRPWHLTLLAGLILGLASFIIFGRRSNRSISDKSD